MIPKSPSCPHCDSTNVVPLNPAVANQSTNVRWYECKECGRLFSRPNETERDPARTR